MYEQMYSIVVLKDPCYHLNGTAAFLNPENIDTHDLELFTYASGTFLCNAYFQCFLVQLLPGNHIKDYLL